MAELLFGKRLRRAEETLLQALMPIGTYMGNDPAEEKIWQEYFGGDAAENTEPMYEGKTDNDGVFAVLSEKMWQTAEMAVRTILGEKWAEAVMRRGYNTNMSGGERLGTQMSADEIGAGTIASGPLRAGFGDSDSVASTDMQGISDFFRRDSRRYDNGFIRY